MIETSAGFEALVSSMHLFGAVLRLQSDIESDLEPGLHEAARMDCLGP